MPIYVYECVGCHESRETIRSVVTRDDDLACECGENMVRTIQGPGLVWAPTSGGWR